MHITSPVRRNSFMLENKKDVTISVKTFKKIVNQLEKQFSDLKHRRFLSIAYFLNKIRILEELCLSHSIGEN